MSLEQILFIALVIAPVVVSFIADMVDEFCLDEFCLDDFMCEMFVIFLALFMAWLVLNCPTCEGQCVPHTVEGRKEWIDLRKGITCSQVGMERWTNEHD